MLLGLASLSKKILGFDAFCLGKKFLVFNLVDRNLKIKYRRSILGYFWTILAPLAMSAIYYFVFKLVMHVERPHYLAFILCGVLPWSFFNQTIIESTESIVANQVLISKIPIPIHVFPYVVSITNFSTLLLSLPVIFVLAVFSGAAISANMLWVLYFFGCLLLLAYTSGAVLAVFYVYMRDLKHAIGLILQVWFYATPIIYDSSMIPQKYKWVLYFNPTGSIFEGIHQSMLGGGSNIYVHAAVALFWVLLGTLALRVTYMNLRSGLVEVL
jgi:ABC-type polysaccharide/polyol phosphate export permease